MKTIYSFLFLFLSFTIYSQEHEDLAYEIEHKSQSWFQNMKDSVDYFQIKSEYEKYFQNHLWEKSKPRTLGENWLKTKIFYLDQNGLVQPEPVLPNKTDVYNSQYYTDMQTEIGSWSMIGPVNSAETGYSGKGNHGGYVYLNRIDPTNSQKMFIAFVTGGLWQTIDGGESWTLTDAGFPDDTYYDIDVCTSNPQIVYALSESQLLKSIDGGLNWIATTMNKTNYSGKAYDIAVSPNDPNIVLVRWDTKIFRTSDGGTTWSIIQSGLSNYSIWDCSVHSEMLDWSTTNNAVAYFISTSNNNIFKIYRTSDTGLTFTEINTTTLSTDANGQIIGWAKLFLPSSNAISIYVAVGTGSSPYGHNAVQLYKFNATDGTQELLRTNMVTGLGNATQNESALHHGDIAMDRTDENKIAYGSYSNTKIHYSLDNGQTFQLSQNLTHSDIRTIDFVNSKVITGSDGEAVVSTDNGSTHITKTNSISNHELWGFGSAFKTNLVASGNNHGPVMIKEAANGFSWYNGTGADQGNTDVNPLDDRYVYSQGYSNYRYFRTGVHTLENQSNYLDLGGIYSYFNSIEFHPNQYYTIITHHAGGYPSGNPNLNTWKNSLIKTEDNGNSITIVKTFNSQVFREKISAKNPNYIYVVEGLTNNKLWKTTDGGTTWIEITPSTTVTSGQTNISDIAVGDENPNEIWVTYSGVQSVCKVLKSNDYGQTWVNLSSAVLTTSPITKIVFQRGSNGGVYIGNKAGVFYRNNTMSDWSMLGNGLPMCDVRFMFINYNEGKLKIGTSKGAFEHNLYETSPPNALISASKVKVTCPVIEKVQFKDYSVVRNSSATWSWTFQGGTPATSSLENPEVSYLGASDGNYDVTLTITDAYGTSTQTLNGFIQIMNQCGTSVADGVPGNTTKLTGQTNADYIKIQDLGVNKNSFTFSCWIKPDGIQEDWSGIFMSQGDTNAFGLNFKNGDNTVGYHPAWSWSSGLQAPAGQWSHIAMVSNGTNVKVYVNGVESTNNSGISSELFSEINLSRYGRGYGNRYAKLEMDEVTIWNRALTTDEIRKWRHLTKSIEGDPILNGLVFYSQFNENIGNITVSKTNNGQYAEYFGSGYSREISTVPVFEGVSEKQIINSAGTKDFSTVGLSMTFDSETFPNGDVWVSKGNIDPDVLPDTDSSFGNYTIVNNYGTNATFSPLLSLSFTDAGYAPYTNAPAYKLYKRQNNDFGNTWGSVLDTGDIVTSNTVTFNTGLSLNSFSQFIITNSDAEIIWNGATWSNASGPNVTKNGVINGDFITNTTNMLPFTAKNIRINEGKTLTVADGKTIVIDEVITNNGTIIAENNGSIVQTNNNGVNISGANAVYKVRRNTGQYYEYDYIYWASPIENKNIGEVFTVENGFNSHKYAYVPHQFNDTHNGTGYPQTGSSADGYDDEGNDWINFNGIMEKGLGYIVMGKGSTFPFNISNAINSEPAYSIEFSGNKINNGIVTTPLFKDYYHLNSQTEADNFNLNLNLVGNPFPSSIDIKKLFQNNETLINGNFYFWTHDKPIMSVGGPNTYDFSNSSFAIGNVVNDNGNYIFTSTASQGYSNGTITIAPKNAPEFVATGQGFFASAKNTITSGTSLLQFDNTLRGVAQSNNSFVKISSSRSESTNDRLWLNLDGTNVFRQIAIGFIPNFSDGLGDGDAPKVSSAHDTEFYSLIPNVDGKFGIQFLSGFELSKTVPLGLIVLESGEFQISIDHFEGVFSDGQNIFLEDSFLNVIHNLSNSPYLFSQNASTQINDRFILRFTNSQLNTDDLLDKPISIYANPISNHLPFTIEIPTDWQNVSAFLYNSAGERVTTFSLHGGKQEVIFDLASGVYSMAIYSEGIKSTHQIIIK